MRIYSRPSISSRRYRVFDIVFILLSASKFEPASNQATLLLIKLDSSWPLMGFFHPKRFLNLLQEMHFQLIACTPTERRMSAWPQDVSEKMARTPPCLARKAPYIECGTPCVNVVHSPRTVENLVTRLVQQSAASIRGHLITTVTKKILERTSLELRK